MESSFQSFYKLMKSIPWFHSGNKLQTKLVQLRNVIHFNSRRIYFKEKEYL